MRLNPALQHRGVLQNPSNGQVAFLLANRDLGRNREMLQVARYSCSRGV